MIRTLLTFTAATLLYVAPAAAQEVRVPFGDLNLSTSSGVETFDARAAAAARSVCASAHGMISNSCVRNVQREARRALPAARQEDYARGRRGDRVLAMAVPAWPV